MTVVHLLRSNAYTVAGLWQGWSTGASLRIISDSRTVHGLSDDDRAHLGRCLQAGNTGE